MATLIKIKRGGATAETAPSQLGAGELAVTYGDAAGQGNSGDRLFIGNSPGNANLIIGGKYFMDLIDHVHGELEASSALIVNSSSKLEQLKVDNLDLNANTLSTTNTNGELVLGPHGTAGVGILAGGSSTPATLKFYEASTNGAHSIAVKSPASVAADVTVTLPAATDTLIGKATTDTVTNKSIDLGTNTVTGSVAEFNSALQSESFATLAGSETLTNKTLTSPTITTPVITEIDSGSTITLDATTDIVLDADGGDIFFKDGGTTFGSATNTSGNLIIKSGTTTAATFAGANITLAGTVGSGAITSTAGIAGTTGTFSGVVDAEVGAHGANVTIGIDSTGELSTSTGNLTIDSAGGTVTIDDNLTIAASKTIDMGANKVTNIADPTSAQDVASKSYVDAVKTGLDIKDSCTVATTADTSSWTYSNGTAGVGATLTASGNGAVSLDSIALTLNMRVLVKDQSPSSENGIYYVSTAGAGGATLVLTRALDANQPAELTGGSFTFVEQGTTQAENGYVFTHNGEPTFGTGNTALTVAQFSGAGQVVAGTGLTKSGNTIDAVGSTTILANADTLEVRSTGTGGQILRSTGTASQAAVWGQVDLADSDAVTGISAIANGGTGASSLTANRLMMANGTSAISVLGAGSQDQVMLSNAGSAPAFGNIDGGTF
jgi:hypothetical protein